MTHNENDKHNLVVEEIKALLGEVEKLTKVMLEKTAQAEMITAQDKITRHFDHYKNQVKAQAHAARQFAANAASGAAAHVKEHPIYTTLTFFSVSWLFWRFFTLLGKK